MTIEAAVVSSYGPIDSLRLSRIDDPQCGADDVIVSVEAVEVNPLDWKVLRGDLAGLLGDRFPLVPGSDVAGRIEAVGGDVDGLALGDRVFGMIGYSGGYAQRIAVPAALLAKIPAGVSAIEAAAVPCAGLTALQALSKFGEIEGKRVLVHGGAGGVGSFFIQLAVAARAEVFATASPANLDYVEGLGATAIDYLGSRFEQEVSGIDFILDTVGGEVQTRSWSVIRPGGLLLATGAAPDKALAEGAGAKGSRIGVRPNGGQMAELAALLQAGALAVHVDTTYPFSDLRRALHAVNSGHARGKRVVVMPKAA